MEVMNLVEGDVDVVAENTAAFLDDVCLTSSFLLT